MMKGCFKNSVFRCNSKTSLKSLDVTAGLSFLPFDKVYNERRRSTKINSDGNLVKATIALI